MYVVKAASRYSIRSLPTFVVELDNSDAGYFDQGKTINMRELSFFVANKVL
jgi:hypothetical protein